jgi:DNA-binding transcriptional MerR regulator
MLVKKGTEMKRDQLLTTGPTARTLGITNQGVILLEKKGKLPAIKTTSGQRLFRLQDVEALRTQREQAAARSRDGSASQ